MVRLIISKISRLIAGSLLLLTDSFSMRKVVGGRLVQGGLTSIPYNEVYIRVGGPGRIACGVDVSTGKKCNDADGTGRSFDHGIGLPVALFAREADYGHLVGLLRTRARFGALFGRSVARGIPLLLLTPELGVRVFTENLQHRVFKTMAWDLNPFQNHTLAYRCGIDNTSESHLRQKLEELIDLDDDKMKQVLTPEEMARIAGESSSFDLIFFSDVMWRSLMLQFDCGNKN